MLEKKQANTMLSSTAALTPEEIIKSTSEDFFLALQTFIGEQITKFLKENEFYRIVMGSVEKVNSDSSLCSIDIGDSIIKNILNKSNKELFRGDTVAILDRYGSNFRNCFIICTSGKETPLEKELTDTIDREVSDLQSQINGLKTSTTI